MQPLQEDCEGGQGLAPDDDVSSQGSVFDEPDPTDTSVLHTDPVASVNTTAINIISNVVGAGILSVPGAFAGMSVIPATFMLTLFAIMSAYSMLLLTLCAQRTGRFTYKDLIEYGWSSFYGRLFDGAIFIYTFACCIAYAHAVGDSMSPVMKTLTGHDSIVTSKGFWILMAALVFFPLSSLKQLSELKISSLFGFIVILYLVLVIVIFFFHQDSPTGGLVNDTTPWFNVDKGFLMNLPICSVAFSCHYNVPVFYGEMRRRRPSRMLRAIGRAVPSILTLYLITAYFSVMHFESKELTKKGDISLNFADSYTPMTVARIGLFIHFVCVFPIICIAARRAMNSILFNRGNMSRLTYAVEAFGLVAVACVLAWVAQSVLQVFNIAGALFGIAIVVIIPNLLYLRIVPDRGTDLEAAHAVSEEGQLLGGNNSSPALNRGRTSSMHSNTSARGNRSASSVHRHRWLDNLVHDRPMYMTYLGRFLVVFGLAMSIASFSINIYHTIHGGDDGGDDHPAPMPPNATKAPNATKGPASVMNPFLEAHRRAVRLP